MGELILITGVSGFIGFKTLILALQAGFRVRAVIRRAEQAKKLQLHAKIAPFTANIDWCIIPDLTDVNLLTSNLTGITGILHLASPLAIETADYDHDIIDPALKLTLSVLNAANVTPSVKRVVITSSAVTLVPFDWLFGYPSNPPDLTLFTPEYINASPSKPYSSSMEAYCASKSLSRIAAQDFMTSHHPSFEIVSLLPTIVFGPDELATSVEELMVGSRALALGPLLGTDFPEMVGATVHVADVARAHIDALKLSIPGNKSYILSSDAPSGIVWADATIFIQRMFPSAVDSGTLTLKGSMPTKKWMLDTYDTENRFGWKFASFEETMKGLVEQYLGFF